MGSKNRQKSAYSSVFFSSQHSSLPSLSTVSSAPEDPTDAFLLHQKTAVQPPCKPKSSPVVEQPPRPPIPLPLQIFFSFFHPALPPTTVSATASAIILTSAALRLDQTGLHLGTPASGSAVSPLLLTGCCMQNEFSFCMQQD